MIGREAYLSRLMGQADRRLVEHTTKKRRDRKRKTEEEKLHQLIPIQSFYRRSTDNSWKRCLAENAQLIVYTSVKNGESSHHFYVAFDLTRIANPVRVTNINQLPPEVRKDLLCKGLDREVPQRDLFDLLGVK